MHLTEGAVPALGPDDVRIHVEAAGVNRADLNQREGKYPPPATASPVLGLEVAGYVSAAGERAAMVWNVGEEVCALVDGGGYATECVAPSVQCLPIPDGFSMVQAAALPEALFTVWYNVFQRGRLSAGEHADVVIWFGDPLEVRSGAGQVFIGGVNQPLEDHQKRLLERYRNLQRTDLPKAYTP